VGEAFTGFELRLSANVQVCGYIVCAPSYMVYLIHTAAGKTTRGRRSPAVPCRGLKFGLLLLLLKWHAAANLTGLRCLCCCARQHRLSASERCLLAGDLWLFAPRIVYELGLECFPRAEVLNVGHGRERGGIPAIERQKCETP
jgi:hypothetical protein